jgi:hypothetical protein
MSLPNISGGIDMMVEIYLKCYNRQEGTTYYVVHTDCRNVKTLIASIREMWRMAKLAVS